MLESALKASVLKLLRQHGAAAEKIHGNAYQRVGIADILACYKGAFLALELKAPGKKPTAAQFQYIREVRAAGGYGAWTDSYAVVETALAAWPDVCRFCLTPLIDNACTVGHGSVANGIWIDFPRMQ